MGQTKKAKIKGESDESNSDGDNGNGKLSCSELKMGIFVLPCVSLSTFCPLACRKDIFYVCKGLSMWPAVLLDLPRV